MLHRILWAGALAGLAVSTPLAAQQRSIGPSFGITPYAGYMKFGNLVSGPLGTSVRNAGAAVYGAEATLGLTSGRSPSSATWHTPSRDSRSARR